MQDNDASATAEAAALLRAVHQVLDAQPRILEDPISVGLVPGSSDAEILSNAESLQSPLFIRLRSSFVTRSRVVEDALERAVAAGARQFVMIGAGYETFAYRQPAWAEDLQIFEFDHPATQRAKRKLMSNREIKSPSNLIQIAVDFESETLADALDRSVFDASAPSFFSCLGVIPYLTQAAIESTLSAILDPARKTWIALSFALPDAMLEAGDASVVQIAAKASNQRGEPWMTRFRPDQMEKLLRSLGCGEVHHISPSELEERFFKRRMDALPLARFEQIMLGSKSAR